jgi:hypothetical protein
MARAKRQSYILFVAEDGEQLKQWAIRVDYLLICLAVAFLCSLFIIAVPLLLHGTRADCPNSHGLACPNLFEDIPASLEVERVNGGFPFPASVPAGALSSLRP